MQASTIMEGLALLVDVASTSSNHGEKNTLLSSKAQEAACTLMELVSHSSLSRFSNSFMGKAKPILKLDLDLLRSCYNSLDKLLKLARDLAFPEKYKNRGCSHHHHHSRTTSLIIVMMTCFLRIGIFHC